MDLGQVLVLSFLQLRHVGCVRLVPIVALHEGFRVVHDVLVGFLLEPEDLYSPKMRILSFLHEMQFLLKAFPLLN